MKFQLALVLVLCLGLAVGETNGRRRSQRRRPPAEIPENVEQDKPDSGKEKEIAANKEVPPVEQPKAVEKTEQKQPEESKPSDAEDGEKKKNQTTPLSQLFVPRATRRPRPLPQGSRRPRPTLPSFIRNPNRQAARSPLQRNASSTSGAEKATSPPTSSSTASKAASTNSGRRRSTAAPSASASSRFGQSQEKPKRSNFRRPS